MKSLITIILLIISAISLTGCTIVKEHYHGHASHEVIVTHTRHRPVGVVIPRSPAPRRYRRRPAPPAPPRPGNRHDRPRLRLLPY